MADEITKVHDFLTQNSRSRWLLTTGSCVLVLVVVAVLVMSNDQDVPQNGDGVSPAFMQTDMGSYVPLADDGLPIALVREPRWATSIDQLVAFSSDALVGIVDSVTPSHQEGYPEPAIAFFDLKLSITGSTSEATGETATLRLDSVGSPLVSDSWPGVGSRILVFAIQDPDGRSRYQFVSSQGLFLVDEHSELEPTIHDNVGAQLRGEQADDVLDLFSSTKAAIASGRLEVEMPTGGPVDLGLGHGDDPAVEAERYADEIER